MCKRVLFRIRQEAEAQKADGIHAEKDDGRNPQIKEPECMGLDQCNGWVRTGVQEVR